MRRMLSMQNIFSNLYSIFFSAASTKQRQEWVSHLRAIAHHFTSQIAQEHPPLSNNMRQRTSSLKAQINENINKLKGAKLCFSFAV